MKVLMNHIYEYQKGVRRMVLFTLNRKYEEFAIRRLESQNISYIVQPVGSDRLNLYFGRGGMSQRHTDDRNATAKPAHS